MDLLIFKTSLHSQILRGLFHDGVISNKMFSFPCTKHALFKHRKQFHFQTLSVIQMRHLYDFEKHFVFSIKECVFEVSKDVC